MDEYLIVVEGSGINKYSRDNISLLMKDYDELKYSLYALTQLLLYCLYQPRINYLNLLHLLKQSNIIYESSLGVMDCLEIINMFKVWSKLCNREVSEYIIKLYGEICISIRLKEVGFNNCISVVPFHNILQQVNPKMYPEFLGWEEVFIVPVVRNIKNYTIKENSKLVSLYDIKRKDVNEFYKQKKLSVTHLSKLIGDTRDASIKNRVCLWSLMDDTQLSNELESMYNSHIWGRDLYISLLKKEIENRGR